jgi:hypothetical protein
VPYHNDTVTTYNHSQCAYWLQTGSANGVIDVRSPVRRTFTLGEFFDIWGQPLSHDRVGPAHGRVTAIVNGARFHGDPRDLPLREHDSIELAVGTPVPAFHPLDWTHSEL